MVKVAQTIKHLVKIHPPHKLSAKGRGRILRQYELLDLIRAYNPELNEDIINRAYVYATKMHGSQLRASGDPYFAHPVEVAGILTQLKLDEASIVTTGVVRGSLPSIQGRN